MTWDGTDRRTVDERRTVDAAAFQLMAETRQKTEDLEKTVTEKIDDLTKELEDHIVRSERRHEELTRRIETLSESTLAAIQGINKIATETKELFKESIPGEDGYAHRKAHEKWVAKAEQEEKFWLDVKKHAVQWAVVAVLGWGGMILWANFVKGPY